MADILRTVLLSPGGRAVVKLNLEDTTAKTWYKGQGTFKIVPPAKTVGWSRSARRFAGQVQSGESTENWTVIGTWWVKGTTPDEVIQNVEKLMSEVDDVAALTPYQPKLLEWRPDGASNSTFFEMRGAGIYAPVYDWRVFAGVPMMRVDLSWPIAPLALGAPMDIWDGLSEDTRTDYTFDKGAVASYNAAVGFFLFTGGTEVLMRHTARGYKYDDVEVTGQWAGTTGNNMEGGAIKGLTLCATDANNFLEGRITVGTPNEMQIRKKVAGVYTTLKAVSGALTLPSFKTGWLRFRKEGNVLTLEAFSEKPGPMVTPPVEILTYTLTGSDATTFGKGKTGYAGLCFTPRDGNEGLVDFRAMPYTYHERTLPELVTLRAVPGTAPSKMDVMVTTPAVGSAQAFGLLAWGRNPAPDNRCWNGDMAYTTAPLSGWNYEPGTGPVTAPNATLDATYGAIPGKIAWEAASLNVSAPNPLTPGGPPVMAITHAVAATVCNLFPIYRRFKKGVTYTFAAKAGVLTGTAAKLVLGNKGKTDVAEVALTVGAGQTMQILTTGTWTPTADYDVAFVGITQLWTSGTGETRCSEVEVYEGTAAPTGQPQSGGRGALPPFGVMQAMNEVPAFCTNVKAKATLAYNAGSNTIVETGEAAQRVDGTGVYMFAGTGAVGGAGTGGLTGGGESRLAWWIDPALMVTADDFARGSIALEFFWRGIVSPSSAGGAKSFVTNPRLMLAAIPDPTQAPGGERYTAEFGNVGRTLPQSTAAELSGNQGKTSRLGTLELPVNAQQPTRWLLLLYMYWSGASMGLFATDELVVVPATRRALTPTGKANDSTYPAWAAGVAELTKTVRSDLRSHSQFPNYAAALNPVDDAGLTGSPLDELPATAGAAVTDLAVLAMLNSLIPDEPGGANGDVQAKATTHYSVTPRYRLARGQ